MTSPASPARADLVCQALRQPQQLLALTPAGWDVLVRQARRAGLLARIACMLEAQGSIDSVPDAPRAHLKAAFTSAEAKHADAMRELARIDLALAPSGVQPVLLEGAAYVAAGLLPAMGRVFTDVDILVPKDRLAEVEEALMSHGWAAMHHSAYDQRYYRKWMHELPPLRHSRRQTVINVRHAILPETARLKPSSARLLSSARPLESPLRFAVLDHADMVLHSTVTLFHSDDLSHGLRDLSDLDLLLRHLGRSPGFWRDLVERARELDLAKPLHYGLRYANRLLGTPVPRDCLPSTNGLGRLTFAISDWFWIRALRPQHSTASDRWTPAALFALNARAHWLRMSPVLALRHLATKTLQLRAPDAADP
jgi:hypothetical protein